MRRNTKVKAHISLRRSTKSTSTQRKSVPTHGFECNNFQTLEKKNLTEHFYTRRRRVSFDFSAVRAHIYIYIFQHVIYSDLISFFLPSNTDCIFFLVIASCYFFYYLEKTYFLELALT